MYMITRMLGYLKKYWHLVTLDLTLTVIRRFFRVYIPLLSTKAIVDEVLLQGQYQRLPRYLLLVVGLYTASSLVSFAIRYLHAYTSQKVVFDIRTALFTALQQQSFSFYDRTKTGQLVARVTSDIRRMTRFYAFWMSSFFGSIVQILLICYYLVGIDGRLTLLSLGTIPLVFIVNYVYMTRIQPINVTIRREYGRLHTRLQQNIVGMRVIRIFTNEEHELTRFTETNDAFFDGNVDATRLRATFRPFTAFLLGLGTTALYWVGGGAVVRTTLSLGALLLSSQYLGLLTAPVRGIGWLITMYSQALAGATRVFEIIDAQPDVTDHPHAVPLPSVTGAVRFQEVTFAYVPDRPVLDKVSFTVIPGETIAILGATGSGKSSLIHLIPRFYDPQDGTITIDGHDIRKVTLQSLRRQVGVVLQDTTLFSATIKENIAFGRPDTTLEDIVTVAKLAQAHDFITAFPQGYETLVGERGLTLSGGQKQRIAIARTLLMDPKIVILDDSTSFVDTKTERALQQALSTLLQDRTTFVITQRLSTIKHATRILVLDYGKLREIGTHDELMTANGIYAHIYRTQIAPNDARHTSPEATTAGGI
jgi:ATP-binding cassette subfamily B protein